MTSEKSQNLMKKIALLLQEDEKGSDDGHFLRAELQKINARLDKIETGMVFQSSSNHKSNTTSQHPSLEKMRIIEELVEEIFSNGQIEKACMFETNKPCDNCSMCNSRGF